MYKCLENIVRENWHLLVLRHRSWSLWYHQQGHWLYCRCLWAILRCLPVIPSSFPSFIQILHFVCSGYNGANPNNNPMCGRVSVSNLICLLIANHLYPPNRKLLWNVRNRFFRFHPLALTNCRAQIKESPLPSLSSTVALHVHMAPWTSRLPHSTPLRTPLLVVSTTSRGISSKCRPVHRGQANCVHLLRHPFFKFYPLLLSFPRLPRRM